MLNDIVICTYCLLLCNTLIVGEGRYPNVEVRKLNSQESEETVQREPFIYTSSELKNEIVVEDASETIENEIFRNEFISEVVSPNEGDESREERMPLRLFVYGVRHHNLTSFRFYEINIYSGKSISETIIA